MFESLATSYLESVTARFPAQRALVFVIGFILSLVISEALSGGIVSTLLKFELVNLTVPSKPPLVDSTIGGLILGLGLAFLGVAASRLTAFTLFRLADRSTKMREKVRKIYRKGANTGSLSAPDRQTEISILEGSLLHAASRIKAFNALAEFSGAVGLLLIAAASISGTQDFVVGLLFTSLLVLCVVRSVQIFISDYFAMAAYKNRLQGRCEPQLYEI